ncbi:hypothetical protein WN944_009371 [Citrus x changshan-huyou]|uniref:Uncharacterized protein n=1 Tax=Citrus x changshan-huyou TaxID=2935761 RepID=A0AAP0QW57_9ROSI
MGKSCMEKPGDCVTGTVMCEILWFEEMLAFNKGETKSEEGSGEKVDGRGEKEDQNGNEEVVKSSDDNRLQRLAVYTSIIYQVISTVRLNSFTSDGISQ